MTLTAIALDGQKVTFDIQDIEAVFADDDVLEYAGSLGSIPVWLSSIEFQPDEDRLTEFVRQTQAYPNESVLSIWENVFTPKSPLIKQEEE